MDSHRIEAIAADWLSRRDGDRWTQADEAAFGAWQSESTAHRVAVIRLQTVWGQADRLQALGAGVAAGRIPAVGQWRVSAFFRGDTEAREKTGSRRRWTVAAGVGLAVCFGIAAHFQAQGAVYRTAVGDSQALHLADGSHVTLNTDSKIHVALNESERRIELDRGEAFFDVAKDTTRPFVVWAANKRIVAVGTKFSVLRAGDDVRVVVTEGRVRMEDNPGPGAHLSVPVQLDAGGVAQADSTSVRVKEASIADAEKYVSWREGFLAFHDTPLAQAVAEFNRYHSVKLVIGDPALADLRIGGNLRTTNMEAFVRVLEQGFPVRATDDGDRILLTSR